MIDLSIHRDGDDYHLYLDEDYVVVKPEELLDLADHLQALAADIRKIDVKADEALEQQCKLERAAMPTTSLRDLLPIYSDLILMRPHTVGVVTGISK